MQHPWTPEQLVEVMKALQPVLVQIAVIIAAIASPYAAWQAKRAHDHASEASAKVDEVHACLENARAESIAGMEQIKNQAAAVAEDAKENK